MPGKRFAFFSQLACYLEGGCRSRISVFAWASPSGNPPRSARGPAHFLQMELATKLEASPRFYLGLQLGWRGLPCPGTAASRCGNLRTPLPSQAYILSNLPRKLQAKVMQWTLWVIMLLLTALAIVLVTQKSNIESGMRGPRSTGYHIAVGGWAGRHRLHAGPEGGC